MSVPFHVSGFLSFCALERWFTNGRLTEKISQPLKPLYEVSGVPCNQKGVSRYSHLCTEVFSSLLWARVPESRHTGPESGRLGSTKGL